MYRKTTFPPRSAPKYHFTNHVNPLKKEWIVYAQTHITDAAKQAQWIAPDQWKEYLNEVFDYFGTGEPESNDNYPLRAYKNTTSFTADGFPIMTTSLLSEKDVIEQIAKRQDFNNWKIRKALRIPSKHEKKTEQYSQETTEAIIEYSQAVKTTIFTMGGKNLERFTALGMPGVPQGVHIKAKSETETRDDSEDKFFVRPEPAMHEQCYHNGQDKYQNQRCYERKR